MSVPLIAELGNSVLPNNPGFPSSPCSSPSYIFPDPIPPCQNREKQGRGGDENWGSQRFTGTNEDTMKSWTRFDHLDKDEVRVRTSWSLSDYGQPQMVSLKYPGPRAATVWPLLRTKWSQCQLTHDSLLCVTDFSWLNLHPIWAL